MEEIGVCCSRSECNQQFDVSSHAPMTGRCDHSLCRKCTWHPPQAEIVPCPMCKEDAAEFEYFYVSVKDVAPNHQMIEMMKNMDAVIEKKKQAKEDSMYREYLATKNLVKCFVCESIVEEKQAKVCRKCHLPSRKFKDSPDCLSVSRPENLDEVKQYLICDSCLLDGPHMNCTERVLPWLPIKLRSEAWMATKSLRKEAELSRYGVKEQSSNLCMSINGVTQTIRSFRSDAEHSVGKQYLKLPEKFEKIKIESEILQKFEGIFHEQVEEHLSDIEDLKRRMLNILDPDAEPDFPARETPMSKQTLSKGLDFLRSFGIRYDPDADAD